MSLSRPDYTGAAVTLKYDPDSGIYIDDTPDWQHSEYYTNYPPILGPDIWTSLFYTAKRSLIKSLLVTWGTADLGQFKLKFQIPDETPVVSPPAVLLALYGIDNASKGPIFVPIWDTTNDLYSIAFHDFLLPAGGGEILASHDQAYTEVIVQANTVFIQETP